MKKYNKLFKENNYKNYVGDINFKSFDYKEDDNDIWDVWKNYVKPILNKKYKLDQINRKRIDNLLKRMKEICS